MLKVCKTCGWQGRTDFEYCRNCRENHDTFSRMELVAQCQHCNKILSEEKGEIAHGCLDCAGLV